MKTYLVALILALSIPATSKEGTKVMVNGEEVNCDQYTITSSGGNKVPHTIEQIGPDLRVIKIFHKGKINAFEDTFAHPLLDYKEADATGTLKVVGKGTNIRAENLTDQQVDECFDAETQAKLKIKKKGAL